MNESKGVGFGAKIAVESGKMERELQASRRKADFLEELLAWFVLLVSIGVFVHFIAEWL